MSKNPMIDVLLIQPPVSFSARSIRNDIIPNCPHIGLLYLAAGIEKVGLKVNIIDAIDGLWTDTALMDFIIQHRPKIVGVSASTMNMRGAVQLARMIKRHNKNTVVCLGGAHMTADPEIVDRFECFDFGVVGQADITFPEVAQRIINYRQIFRGVIPSVLPSKLDELPFPARHLVDWGYYIKRRNLSANTVLASRGCTFNCIFCSIPNILRKHCKRSAESIIEEMITAYEFNKLDTFVFSDDVFSLDKQHILSLCDALRRLKRKFKWAAQTRPDLVDDMLLKEMRAAGCYNLLFGVESGNERIRTQVINKKITDEQISNANELCYKHHIQPDWYLMLGFPSETRKELYDTVNFPLKVRYQPNIIGTHITLPLPGSILFAKSLEAGIIAKDLIDDFINGTLGEGFKDVWPYYVPSGLTIEELKEARNYAYRRFYFRPSYILKRVKRDLCSFSALKNDIKQGWVLLCYGRSADDK
jgi:radical SAM superfamily enzyme YgiQ (UPF0313 family)